MTITSKFLCHYEHSDEFKVSTLGSVIDRHVKYAPYFLASVSGQTFVKSLQKATSKLADTSIDGHVFFIRNGHFRIRLPDIVPVP